MFKPRHLKERKKEKRGKILSQEKLFNLYILSQDIVFNLGGRGVLGKSKLRIFLLILFFFIPAPLIVFTVRFPYIKIFN